MNYQTWNSPIGRIHLVASENGLAALAFDENWKKMKERFAPLEESKHSVITAAIGELSEYFAGRRSTFTVPLAVQGTPFQKKAWAALRRIPFGQTATYAQQAVRIRQPSAVRAVGRANGMNPVSIIIPCHRVVGSNGNLTGYAGGLRAKRALLTLEGHDATDRRL